MSLFVCRVRLTAREDSDWDILILVDQEKVTLKDEQRFRHKLIDVEFLRIIHDLVKV